jgi:nitroreductase
MEKRRSVREYKNKALDKKQVMDIVNSYDYNKALVEGVKFDFIYFEDGDNIYQILNGVVGYSGVLIKAPQYAVLLSDEKPGYLYNSGYVGEWISLKFAREDIGSCWIEVGDKDKEVKEILGITSKKRIIGLMALGYPKMDVRLSKIYDTIVDGHISPYEELGYPNIDTEFSKEPVSYRHSVEDIVYKNEFGNKMTFEEIEKSGYLDALYYMRLAPSWGNRQPWKFIIRKDGIILLIEKSTESESEMTAQIEAGIAMLYFKVAMHDLGLPGDWKNINGETDIDVPKNYFYGGIYSL